MGSGLILLVIVGAWLAVLVPMALRSHDASNSLGGVDKFTDAMRVLSRRNAVTPTPEDAPEAQAPVAAARPPGRSAAARRAAAARRRRLLLGLIAIAVLTLAGVVLGPLWLLGPHLLVDLLLVAVVVQLRRTALRRAERDLLAAMRSRPAGRAEPARTGSGPAESAPAESAPAAAAASCAVRHAAHVAGVPDRMPARPAPLEAPAARHEDAPLVAPARGAQGEAWSPVPVPTPTYLSAPVAPRRRAEPSRASSEQLAEAERELGIVDEGPQLDEILDRRRAVNDW